MLSPPAWMAGGDIAFPLGTDSLGRDVLSRLLYGSRIALTVAVIAAFGAGVFGSLLAIIAGYFGGWVDRAISYLVDLWMSFPPVVLSLVLMVSLGVGIENVILSIVLVDWTRFCPRGARRSDGGAPARLCPGRATDEFQSSAHHVARDSACGNYPS